MTSEVAVALLDLLNNAGITVWVDGGWGVDALLGQKTRPHADLDIVVQERDVAKLRELLAGEGFIEVPREDTRPWNFVFGGPAGPEIDVHVIVFDTASNGVYGPPDNGDIYPAASLSGRGEIAGKPVRCISAEWQVLFHTGYAWNENDRHDVGALCERYGLDAPGDPRQRLW